MRTVGYVVAVLIIASTAASALWDGWRDLIGAVTILQWVVGVAVVVYTIAGLTTLLALWQKGRWITLPAATWAVACILAGGVAPVAYGGAGWAVGSFSGMATALIVVPVVYFLNRQEISRRAR